MSFLGLDYLCSWRCLCLRHLLPAKLIQFSNGVKSTNLTLCKGFASDSQENKNTLSLVKKNLCKRVTLANGHSVYKVSTCVKIWQRLNETKNKLRSKKEIAFVQFFLQFDANIIQTANPSLLNPYTVNATGDTVKTRASGHDIRHPGVR